MFYLNSWFLETFLSLMIVIRTQREARYTNILLATRNWQAWSQPGYLYQNQNPGSDTISSTYHIPAQKRPRLPRIRVWPQPHPLRTLTSLLMGKETVHDLVHQWHRLLGRVDPVRRKRRMYVALPFPCEQFTLRIMAFRSPSCDSKLPCPLICRKKTCASSQACWAEVICDPEGPALSNIFVLCTVYIFMYMLCSKHAFALTGQLPAIDH